MQLASNFERVQGELVRTRKKFNDARSQLLEVDRTKVEADRATELAVQKWKAQLDQRSRELEELQARLAPQDLDLLRIQVQEELEGPHRDKLAHAEEQANAYQQMFFNTRRECERLKAEFEQYVAYHGAALKAGHDEHAAELSQAKAALDHTRRDLTQELHEMRSTAMPTAPPRRPHLRSRDSEEGP